ncbi:MAG: glutamine synthetase family protein [Gammaproteobacteria bacterium]
MSEYERIRVLFCDHVNLARGKYLPPDFAQSGRVRLCIGVYALGYDRVMLDAPGAMMRAGLPDLEAVFDIKHVRPGWEPATGVVVADQLRDEQALPMCGRGLLKRTIAQWEGLGYAPQVGIELEAFIFQRHAHGQWIPYDTPGAFVYGTGAAVDPEGLIDDIWQQARKCGFPLEAINSEYDWPQFEFTLQYSDALSAVDNVFLFRLMAKELMAKRGYLMSFMPKPLSDRGGSGLHVNFSLNDRDGNNALADPAQPDGLSELCKQCIAGLLHHHEGMAGLLAPTVNSYRRLRPASLSGYWANWGYDHRGVTARVPAQRGKATRIEYRLADGAANPYVAVAVTLQAARLGLTQKYKLPAAETGDGLETTDTERCVPENLGAALTALEADEKLVAAVGRTLVDNFIAIKRKEWEDYLSATTDWELSSYLEFI